MLKMIFIVIVREKKKYIVKKHILELLFYTNEK